METPSGRMVKHKINPKKIIVFNSVSFEFISYMLVLHHWVEAPIFKAINANLVGFIDNIKSCFHVINLSSVFVCNALDVNKLYSKKVQSVFIA